MRFLNLEGDPFPADHDMIGDCLFLSMFDKTNGRRFDVAFSPNEITIASSRKPEG